ncbi:MAG TPA: 50S ribosomal protein L20 [Clostridiales bacterium]|nr:50S ribosomal protein L20 [Clostridiales bacterium]
MRIKRSVNALKKRRKVMKAAKGFRGSRSTLYRVAKESVLRSRHHAYIGRRLKKRDMRSLWIARINAACRQNDISYSKFMHGLKVANVELNRKVLSNLAIEDPSAFAKLVETAKKA